MMHNISLSLMHVGSHILTLQYLGLCPSLRQIVLMTFVNLMVVVMFLHCLSLSLSKLDLMMIFVKLPGLVVLILGALVFFMVFRPPPLPLGLLSSAGQGWWDEGTQGYRQVSSSPPVRNISLSLMTVAMDEMDLLSLIRYLGVPVVIVHVVTLGGLQQQVSLSLNMLPGIAATVWTNLVHDSMGRERDLMCLIRYLGVPVVIVILATLVFLMHGMMLWYLSLCLNLRRIVLMTFVNLIVIVVMFLLCLSLGLSMPYFMVTSVKLPGP